ncbi:MAG: hypothetical protein IH914_09145, partial [candidate division Zixibacteria bacterium]|nr:hypothetical protein [candidate division Zixibacteria bacterium]
AQQTATVIENTAVARDTYRVRLECPEIAAGIVPGQFVMLRLAGWDDPLLGRPLALYDTVFDDTASDGDDPIGIDLVYLVVGKLTGHLARFRAGAEVEVWGPAGAARREALSMHTWDKRIEQVGEIFDRLASEAAS